MLPLRSLSAALRLQLLAQLLFQAGMLRTQRLHPQLVRLLQFLELKVSIALSFLQAPRVFLLRAVQLRPCLLLELALNLSHVALHHLLALLDF